MGSVLATIGKELLLLRRDKAGLLVLFVMPATLVLVITLVQDNILNTTGTTGVKALFINHDDGEVSKKIKTWLGEKGGFDLITEIDGKPVSEAQAREVVKSGDYQFCLILPEGLTKTLKAQADQQADKSLSALDKNAKAKPKDEKKTDPSADPLTRMQLFFDPTVQGSFRTAVTTNLERMIQAVELEEKADAFSKKFPVVMRKIIKEKIMAEIGDDIPKGEQDEMIGKIPEIHFNWSKDRTIGLDQRMLPAPTAVQQNVPAWTLFGMFFIVVPLGGSLLRERQEGTFTRLLAMPVPYVSLLLGKIAAYVMVCMVQFVLMLLVGRYILPLFGTPVLELGNSPLGLIVVALASSLAATGFGILIGTLTRSYEQASMFGSVSVVIAAAIGGVMVPVYVMPKAMKAISVYSPLSWGLNGFLEIFVREGTVVDALRWALPLLVFFAACLGAAWYSFHRRGSGCR